MSISLCMIVKNEATKLPACLSSVQGLVDEIIVLDTGSTDDTISIAQQGGAQVTSVEWQNNFAAARNQSLERATGEWILVLDADETLTAAGQELLQQVRSKGAIAGTPMTEILVVTLLRLELDTDQTPYSEVSRLFRNRPEIRFHRPYHESVDDDVAALLQAEPQWQVVAYPDLALEHTGYALAEIVQRDKFIRAQTIMQAFLDSHPEDAYIANKLGALYCSMGETERGRSLLEKALQSGQADATTRYELHYHLGVAYRDIQLPALALDHYCQAIAQPIPEVLKVGAYLNLGSLWQARQQYSQAIATFEKAIAAAPNFALAHYNLGLARRNAQDLEGAVTAYEQAIALDPRYAPAYQNLGVALFKQNKLTSSLKAFQQAISLYRDTNPAAAEQLLENIRNLGY
jgi:tetratricopeptide (TPR) repeat protein